MRKEGRKGEMEKGMRKEGRKGDGEGDEKRRKEDEERKRDFLE